MKSRPATIRDVARRAKVSVASVSRALNGHKNVRDDTRDRVLQAIDDLHYVPNAAARSLSSSQTRTLGVVLPDLHGEFFSELIRGMDKAASERGYLLLLSTMHADPQLAGQAIAVMRGRVDGLAVMAPQLSRDAIDRLMPEEMPGVQVICQPSKKRPSFIIDNREGAASATRHLLAIGRRRLAHIAGPEGNFDARERRQGFLSAIAAAGAPAPLVGAGDFGEDGGARIVRDWLARGERFDGVMAANDMTAIGALEALRAHGLRVPEDVALIGFDDIPLARHLGLSTVRVPVADIGAAAVERLVAMVTSQEAGATPEVQPLELVLRATTQGRPH
ncbi:MAG TPA: LacI family transcriptional regulator [Parvularcula sp.]|nr:LacI family transcriptional regulator [Parvularcula sp.]HBS31776.1 LacI family transcriptional regulator [Parvularcula sp.]HBS34591.1 LacI family transcriptional regulator [Parvularcula sp.]